MAWKEIATARSAASPMYEWTETYCADRRFELVRIAFKEVLKQTELTPGCVVTRAGRAHLAVSLADAVLAEMDKETVTEPNTKERTEDDD